MEFISVNEFLKQDEKVQKVFLDWWKPNDGDVYWWNEEKYIDCCYNLKFIDNTDVNNLKYKEITPLLTEGQLRKFIDDKTAFKLEITQFEDGEWNLSLYKNGLRDIEIDCMNLLQAYWKAAIQIAKES